jgi:hypothetical protein
MTEAEWFHTDDAKEMVNFLCQEQNGHRRKVGRRKLRLFGCACCRNHWDVMIESRSRAAVEYMERLADEADVIACLEKVQEDARQGLTAIQYSHLRNPADPRLRDRDTREDLAATAAHALVSRQPWMSALADQDMRMYVGEGDEVAHRLWRQRLKRMADLLRDIFGNPFQVLKVPRGWQTANVVALAQVIYDERVYDRMPILGDALEDAGCTNADMLMHCRQPGEHVRGCWVVDLLLDKK